MRQKQHPAHNGNDQWSLITKKMSSRMLRWGGKNMLIYFSLVHPVIFGSRVWLHIFLFSHLLLDIIQICILWLGCKIIQNYHNFVKDNFLYHKKLVYCHYAWLAGCQIHQWFVINDMRFDFLFATILVLKKLWFLKIPTALSRNTIGADSRWFSLCRKIILKYHNFVEPKKCIA